MWVSQGDDEVECLAVEIWIDDFPVRVVTAYGPQSGDKLERKVKFWEFIEREANKALDAGAGFILQMDSNAHLGKDIIEKDPNEQNLNGKLFCDFLERLPHLTIINSLELCEGSITRMRKTINGVERSILDVFVTCHRILPYVKSMRIDEKREHSLTNYSAINQIGRVIESDHNVETLEVNLEFSSVKPERMEIFQFKNLESQALFKKLTSNTTEFSSCFQDETDFVDQANKWRKVLNNYFHKSFKKVRITNKKQKKTGINDLMERRKQLLKKQLLEENEEEEITKIEETIADLCQEGNMKKVMENFSDMNGADGNINQQGVWKTKKKLFPKINPSLPVGKKNLDDRLITNPEELKELYLNSFKFRLRHRPAQPGYESLLDKQEELFKLRLDVAKKKKTPPWQIEDLEVVLKGLKNGKCRDPEGMIREIFKEEVMGKDLKISLLILLNKIKDTGIIPAFMRIANICAIYKGKGEVSQIDSDRGIFIVSILRTILMKMMYQDKYEIIDKSMSDSNIGARKRKNIRNHIFVVNSIIHDVLSKKSNEPIDIMVLDYKQMFDSECLFECMNDVFEAGVDDDYFCLMYEANKENFVAVQTPNGLSRREPFNEIVMQGDVLAPLISSLQVDTMGKECLVEAKHLFYYKDKVPVPPLGLVDDLFTISYCGYKTKLMNKYINTKTAMKKLQFGTSKCMKLHVGKTCNKNLCEDLYVGGWKLDTVKDMSTGGCTQLEYFGGMEKMGVTDEQMYLGDIISSDGKPSKNVQARKNKSLGIINQIMDIMKSVFFGKYYFEVALVLRSSLLLSSILLNSEAWINLSDKDIRVLEKADEMLLSRILESDSNTSNTFKYLELGIYPLRFELMKRTVMFLQYILKQEKSSMIYQVFIATWENPIKNDFVKSCEKYLSVLDIKLSFKEIELMSKWSLKKIVKSKVEAAGLKYLLDEKSKQSKISHIKYEKLEIQGYLVGGNCSINISKLIFKARSKTLDIKAQQKWKYEDKLCIGCSIKDETGEEILLCRNLSNTNNENEQMNYDWFYENSINDMVKVAKNLSERLKNRQKIIDGKS